MRRNTLLLGIGAVTVASVVGATTSGWATTGHRAPQAHSDVYPVTSGHPVSVSAKRGLLANDSGGPLTLVAQGSAAHGTFHANADGSFTYAPAAGYVGPDTASYTATDAVQLYSTHLPPLATVGGVDISAGAYGSSLAPVPGSKTEFYGLTDRGPNVDAPDGNKIEPIPTFTPAIGKFRFVNGQAILEKRIPLRAGNGSALNGLVSTVASTGETIEDINGNALPQSPNGFDSEGLVALKDGTFWVSDEYGPFIAHFDRNGRMIQRLSPGHGLPAELAARVPNKGMEGLTIMPDGKTLVGIMQNALAPRDLAKAGDAKDGTVTRIVTVSLRTGATHEYLYLLDSKKTGNSEITALSNTEFLVDERDGNFPTTAIKNLYKIDIQGATDVGPTGGTYDATLGRTIAGKSVEAATEEQKSADAAATLTAAGIEPVSKVLYLDLNALLGQLDPTGAFFNHDKIEGVATTDRGRTLVISNDSDFGISGATGAHPYQLTSKIDPATGRQDDGEYLVVHLDKLPLRTTTGLAVFDVTP